MTYATTPLANIHQKQEFDCGNSLLNRYLHRQAKQDMKRKLAICFVLANEENLIQGYYTLSNDGIPREWIPEGIQKKMPPTYTSLPVTLLGRLAVDSSFKGQGLGELLLFDALKRSYDVSISSIGSMAIVVDPINDQAIAFYEKYGFVLLPGSGKMFLPMKVIEQFFK